MEWVSGVFKLFFHFSNVSLSLRSSFAIMNDVILCYYDVFENLRRKGSEEMLTAFPAVRSLKHFTCFLVSVLSSSLHHQTNRDL